MSKTFKIPPNWKSSKPKISKNKNSSTNSNNNNNNLNFDRTCFYCKKKGHLKEDSFKLQKKHLKEDCFKLKKKIGERSTHSSAEQAEVVLVGMCEEIFNRRILYATQKKASIQ